MLMRKGGNCDALQLEATCRASRLGFNYEVHKAPTYEFNI